MTFMRDFGFVYSLSKVLNHLGCETFVCSNTDYLSAPMRLWDPDVVFYVTVGRTERIRKAFPRSILVLWNAESCRFDTYPPLELEIASNRDSYLRMGKVLLWGEGNRELLIEYAHKNKWEWITGDMEGFERKFVVVGHPRIDLARYGAPGKRSQNEKIKVGIIGLCAAVNNGKFSIPELLLNDDGKDDNFVTSQEFCFQMKYYQLIKRMIIDFGTEKYEYNLRPYFLENINNYAKSELVSSGKLKIDNSIEFTSWIKRHDLIIGAVSTTMYLVAAAGKPYISLDFLLDRPMERIVFAKEYLSGITSHCPKSYDDFVNMVKNHENLRLTFESSDVLKRQYSKFLKPKEDLPTLYLMAMEIIKSASEREKISGLPTALCKFINRTRTAYAEFRGLSSKTNDYSHFKNKMLYEADIEFGSTVDEILKSVPSGKTLQEK